MRSWTINHKQDLSDAKIDLDDLPMNYRLMAVHHKPDKNSNGYDKWANQNAFFHRGVCSTYSKLSGLGEDECKRDLQIRFACVAEYKDHYDVESIGDMGNKRLAEFIEACVHFLAMEYGEIVDKMLLLNINKTKKVKK